MKNHGSVLAFFKWGGMWEHEEQVPLMSKNAYTLVKIIFWDSGRKKVFYDVTPAFDLNELELDFRVNSRNPECEIEKVVVVKRSNDYRILEKMKEGMNDV